MTRPVAVATTQELIDSINENTQHTDCPLDHSDAPESYHKEPLPAQEAADNALTPSGYIKTTLHLKDPAGIYYTTVVAEKT